MELNDYWKVKKQIKKMNLMNLGYPYAVEMTKVQGGTDLFDNNMIVLAERQFIVCAAGAPEYIALESIAGLKILDCEKLVEIIRKQREQNLQLTKIIAGLHDAVEKASKIIR